MSPFFEKYLKKTDKILDIGCGAGRTTIGLYKLGLHSMVGIDLSDKMIEAAKRIAKESGYPIRFQTANALDLPFSDIDFDAAIFSYNGLMQVPGIKNREKALSEINRVLKPKGFFIFTTHDREMAKQFKSFWDEEKKKWDDGQNDSRLHDYGDRIVDEQGKEVFLHFPTRDEVISSLEKTGFSRIEDIWRPDLCEESETVRTLANDCRLWIAQKRKT